MRKNIVGWISGVGYWIFFLLAAAEPLRLCAAADWPQLARDAARTGHTPESVSGPFQWAWAQCFDEMIRAPAQPIVAEGKVFIGTCLGNLYALDRATGAVVWKHDCGSPILHTAGYENGTVYFTAHDGKLRALDARDGSEKWTFAASDAVWGAPLLAVGLIVFGSKDGNVYAVSSAGELQWKTGLGAPVNANAAALGGKVFIGAMDMHMHALSLEDGKPLWKSEKLHGMSMHEYWPVATKDALIVTSTPVYAEHILSQLIQNEVLFPYTSTIKQLGLLKNEQVMFDAAREWLGKHPARKTFYVLDPLTGQEKYIAPILYWAGGGSQHQAPAVSPDGYAYLNYVNFYSGGSGWIFCGRMKLDTGQVEPLIDIEVTKLPEENGYFSLQIQDFLNVDWRERQKGVWPIMGDFPVSDQPWTVSLAGETPLYHHWVYGFYRYDAGRRRLAPMPDRNSGNFANEREWLKQQLAGQPRTRGFLNIHHVTSAPAVSDGWIYFTEDNIIKAIRGGDNKEAAQ